MPDTFRYQPEALPKAWPFEEAAKLAARLDASGKDVALFETGYGPSGLPHIGTFNEVLRTTFVRNAYEEITGQPTRLIAFSDDIDGLRKVPDNLPDPQRLEPFLGNVRVTLASTATNAAPEAGICFGRLSLDGLVDRVQKSLDGISHCIHLAARHPLGFGGRIFGREIQTPIEPIAVVLHLLHIDADQRGYELAPGPALG